jgi:hypothetical protein
VCVCVCVCVGVCGWCVSTSRLALDYCSLFRAVLGGSRANREQNLGGTEHLPITVHLWMVSWCQELEQEVRIVGPYQYCCIQKY